MITKSYVGMYKNSRWLCHVAAPSPLLRALWELVLQFNEGNVTRHGAGKEGALGHEARR